MHEIIFQNVNKNKKEQTNAWVFVIFYVNKESKLTFDSFLLIFYVNKWEILNKPQSVTGEILSVAIGNNFLLDDFAFDAIL